MRRTEFEPICKVLPIAPSTYRAHIVQRRDPTKASARAKRDADLSTKIRRAFDENFQVYGVRKVWRQLKREGENAARCTVARLMRALGLRGVVRGKSVKTTISDRAAPCPQDKVNRQFQAPRPNALWVSDFTYVATWQGFVYVAFVIDTFARRIVGWRVSRTAHANFVLDALECACRCACLFRCRRVDDHEDQLCALRECRLVIKLSLPPGKVARNQVVNVGVDRKVMDRISPGRGCQKQRQNNNAPDMTDAKVNCPNDYR